MLPDNLFKARIPAGAFHLITTSTLPLLPTTNSLDRNNNPLEHANHIANQLFDNEDFVKRDKHSTDEHACPGTDVLFCFVLFDLQLSVCLCWLLGTAAGTIPARR